MDIVELLNSVIKYFTDSTEKLTKKASVFLLILISLFIIDNFFGFSFYYNIDKKVSLAKEIDLLLKDSTLSLDLQQKMIAIRKDVLLHQSILYNFKNWIFNTLNGFNIWHNLTAGWIWFILMISMPLNHTFSKDTKPTIKILAVFFAEVLFLSFAVLDSKILSYVPLLFGNKIYNYIFNFVINFIIFYIFRSWRSSRQTNKITNLTNILYKIILENKKKQE